MKHLTARITMSLLLVAGYSIAAQAATVAISPSASVVNNGDIFSLDLVGLEFDSGDLDGGGINFTFDASVLNVTNVTVNVADWEFFSTEGTVDNGAGSVNGISFNSFQSNTGDLLFATVDFLAVGLGVSGFTLSEFSTNPFSSGGMIYPGLDFDPSGQVTVSEVPVPAAFWLLGSALLVLARKTGKSKLSC